MNLSNLFQNHSLDTDSYEYVETENNKQINKQINRQIGGNNDVPTGGFLPIYICDNKDKEVESNKNDDEQSKREYKTHKSAVSIKTILEKRRENTPFIKT